MTTTSLILHVKKKYFIQIQSGEKIEEYRLVKPYWISRLKNKNLKMIFIINGYPQDWCYNPDCFVKFPYSGFKIKMIKHGEFGDHLVRVFAIELRGSKAVGGDDLGRAVSTK